MINQEIVLNYWNYGFLYFTALSLVAFSFMGIDKNKAQVQKRRISEKQLIFLALLGGSIGIAFGMLIFKHKTSKKKFYLGIPGIYVLQCIFLFGMLYLTF